MTDIVERLREEYYFLADYSRLPSCEVMLEAADEIKRLREIIKDCADSIAGERCSHVSPCGADNPDCSVQDLYAAARGGAK